MTQKTGWRKVGDIYMMNTVWRCCDMLYGTGEAKQHALRLALHENSRRYIALNRSLRNATHSADVSKIECEISQLLDEREQLVRQLRA